MADARNGAGQHNQALLDFKAASKENRPWLYSRIIIDDLITPVAAMLNIGPDRANTFLLESVQGGESRARYSVIGIGANRVLKIENGKTWFSGSTGIFRQSQSRPLAAIKTFIRQSELAVRADLPPMVHGVFGYVGFDAVQWTEQIKLMPTGTNAQSQPEAMLIEPRHLAVFDSLRQEIILTMRLAVTKPGEQKNVLAKAKQALDDLAGQLLQQRPNTAVCNETATANLMQKPASNTTDSRFRKIVSRAKEYICAGDAFQVVLSQKFTTSFLKSSFGLYRALRKSNPSPFMYYFAMGDFEIVGSSPEILVRVRDDKMTVRPIAGTRPRGNNEKHDLALEQELLADKKERAEHLMLVDLARNDVGRVCEPGSVSVSDAFSIERYSRVMHIVSNVTGTLRNGMSSLDALFAGFPHGTVSGAPKIRAMEIISELESERRGIYAGAVGYFTAHGDLDTCIALRTALIQNGEMSVQAGAGIVLDSDEDTELEETRQKAGALFDAASEAWRFCTSASKNDGGS